MATVIAGGVAAAGTVAVNALSEDAAVPPPSPQSTTIINDLSPAFSEVSEQIAAASSDGAVATPALNKIIENCADDTVRKYEAFTSGTAEDFCAAMVRALVDDRELSANERSEIRKMVIVPFCVQTLLDMYDSRDPDVGEDVLALQRDELKERAPLTCETTFADELDVGR